MSFGRSLGKRTSERAVVGNAMLLGRVESCCQPRETGQPGRSTSYNSQYSSQVAIERRGIQQALTKPCCTIICVFRVWLYREKGQCELDMGVCHCRTRWSIHGQRSDENVVGLINDNTSRVVVLPVPSFLRKLPALLLPLTRTCGAPSTETPVLVRLGPGKLEIRTATAYPEPLLCLA